MHATSPRILYCHCAFAQVLPKDVKLGVLQQLTESGVDFECVPDLCEMSARHDPVLQEIAQRPNVRIAACYPRAVQGLFTAAGTPLGKPGPEIINLRVLSAAEAAVELLRPADAPSTLTTQSSAAPPTTGESP